MSQRQKNITALKPLKTKIMDMETKRIINYISITTKITKDKTYNCWWCTLQIENTPVGCPLSVKCETNSTKKETFTYYTDGIFCCFNCIKAYVMEYGQHDIKYKDSIRLLALMLYDNNDNFDPNIDTNTEDTTNIKKEIEPKIIHPSPPWRFLSQYGGHVTPQQYKEMINRVVYKEKGIIQLHPITTLYEEIEKH